MPQTSCPHSSIIRIRSGSRSVTFSSSTLIATAVMTAWLATPIGAQQPDRDRLQQLRDLKSRIDTYESESWSQWFGQQFETMQPDWYKTFNWITEKLPTPVEIDPQPTDGGASTLKRNPIMDQPAPNPPWQQDPHLQISRDVISYYAKQLGLDVASIGPAGPTIGSSDSPTPLVDLRNIINQQIALLENASTQSGQQGTANTGSGDSSVPGGAGTSIPTQLGQQGAAATGSGAPAVPNGTGTSPANSNSLSNVWCNSDPELCRQWHDGGDRTFDNFSDPSAATQQFYDQNPQLKPFQEIAAWSSPATEVDEAIQNKSLGSGPNDTASQSAQSPTQDMNGQDYSGDAKGSSIPLDRGAPSSQLLATLQRARQHQADLSNAEQTAQQANADIDAQLEKAKSQAQLLREEQAKGVTPMVPSDWVPCTCPNLHPGAGIFVHGVQYHTPLLRCSN